MNTEIEETLAGRVGICARMVGGPQKLAGITGIPRRTLDTYLAGTSDIKTERLVKISLAAGVTVGWLAAGEGPKVPMGHADETDSPSHSKTELGTRIGAVCERLETRKHAASVGGISTDQLARYINGTSQPGFFAVAKICAAAGVSLDWLWTGGGAMSVGDSSGTRGGCDREGELDEFDLVPLYNIKASAGHGRAVADEQIVAQMAFRKYWLRKNGLKPENLCMVLAKGDSMVPAIEDGDILLLDSSNRTPEDGRVYVLRVNDELLVKRLQRLVDGSLRVSSDNNQYATEVIPPCELDRLQIIGRAIWKGSLI